MKWINPYLERRRRMVADQLAARGVHDPRVLEAMSTVPREAFVDESLRHLAYADRPLPIGASQTISQPYIVGTMAEALGLQGGENVLEVGTGSGYAAAVLSHLADAVHTIERIPELADRARDTLERLGYRRIHVIGGDGTVGFPKAAPYDAIVVTAQGPRLPPSLCAQLKPGGRLVMPVTEAGLDEALVRMTRGRNGGDRTERLDSVRFVPLVGAEGWPQ